MVLWKIKGIGRYEVRDFDNKIKYLFRRKKEAFKKAKELKTEPTKRY